MWSRPRADCSPARRWRANASACRPANVPAATAIGALAHYVSGYQGSDFQPMNVTFGIMEPLPSPPRGKRERYQAMAQRALAIVKELKTSLQ